MAEHLKGTMAATERGQIDGEAENPMPGSGSDASSSCWAPTHDCVADDHVTKYQRVMAPIWSARFRALAEAVYHAALACIDRQGPGLVVVDGVAVNPQGREKPNIFRQQHGAARAIDRYRSRGSISEREYQAADRLWEDLTRAGLSPRVTANLLGAGGGGECAYGMATTIAQVAARQRVRMAESAVGRRLWATLVAVVWDEMTATAWAQCEGVRNDRGHNPPASWRFGWRSTRWRITTGCRTTARVDRGLSLDMVLSASRVAPRSINWLGRFDSIPGRGG